MKTKLAVIDADSMIYIIAWKFKNKKIANLVKASLDSFITGCLNTVGATHYTGFYGSHEDGASPNFRNALVDNYKANRPETPDFIVKWRPVIHEQMKNKWSFKPVDGMEADDAVAISVEANRANFDEIVVITADKDLKQIPNIVHYDMNKHIETVINQFDADAFLAEQMLKGDAGDNIKGLPGIGPKKAKTSLENCKSSIELKWTVMRMYRDYFDTQRNKFITSETKLLSDKWLADNKDQLELKGFLPKQIDRKKRLSITSDLEGKLYEKRLDLDWKYYIVQQHSLLKMLTESPEGFELPEVQEYANAPTEETDTAIKDILNL